MKKLLGIFFLLLLNYTLKAQGYPISQSIGSDSTLVTSKGALKSRLINYSYTDTIQANTQRIKQYPGAQIFTTSDSNMWYRTPNANKWVQFFTNRGGTTGDTLVWKQSGNYVADRVVQPVLGTKTFTELPFITNDTTRMTIGVNGIRRTSSAQYKYVMIDTTSGGNFYLAYGDGGSGSSYTSSNGITLTGSNFKLGGTLVDATTTINGGGNDFIFNNIATWNVNATEPSNISTTSGGLTGTLTVDAGHVDINSATAAGFGQIRVEHDSIHIEPPLGRLKIDTINYTLSTTGKKIMLRDTATGLVQNIDPALLAGATPGLQTVITQDATLTTDNTINGSGYDWVHNAKMYLINSTDEASLSTISGGVNSVISAANSSAQISSTSGTTNSTILVSPDSITVNPNGGVANIDSLRSATDTTTRKPMVWSPATGRWEYLTYWPGGGGSTSPAGNFGNVQINRNSAFDTPASDSLDFESATGLTVKGNITSSTLTSGRVVLSGTSGVLADDANLTFASSTLNIGVASSSKGILTLSGNTSGTVTVQPAAAAGTWTMTLPTNDGDANQVLQTNGSGVTSWATPAAGSALTSTYVGFGDGSNLLTGSSRLTWNGNQLDINGASNSGFRIYDGSGANMWYCYNGSGGAGNFGFYNNTSGKDQFVVLADGSVQMGGIFSAPNFKVNNAGSMRAYSYGSGSITGTATYALNVDASGNIIEGALPGAGLSGSGTNLQLALWNGTSTLTGHQRYTWANSNDYPSLIIGAGTGTTYGASLQLRDPNGTYGQISTEGGQMGYYGSSTYKSHNFYDYSGGVGQIARFYSATGAAYIDFAGATTFTSQTVASNEQGAVTIARTVPTSGANPQHGFTDQTLFKPGAAFNSFGSFVTFGNNTINQDHYAGFQNVWTKDSSNTMGTVYGFVNAVSEITGGTITNLYGYYNFNPTVTSGSIGSHYGIYIPTVTGATTNVGAFFGSKVTFSQGTDVASAAGAITLSTNGNTFEITGTAAITLISNAGWVNGSEINLVFTSTATLTDGTANSGTDIGMELEGNANFTGSSDDIVTLVLCELGGTQRWRMKSKSIN